MANINTLIIHRHTFHERRYAMKKHDATRLHYDLRLEWNGFVLSWAILDGPNRNPFQERRSIEMEDHRSEYLFFEGLHRTGTIMLWDFGTWEPHPSSMDIKSAMERGVFRFILRAEKLQGSWTLTKTTELENEHPVWNLRKDDDQFAIQGIDNLLEQRPNSVNRERSMEDIVREWNEGKKDLSQQLLFFRNTKTSTKR